MSDNADRPVEPEELDLRGDELAVAIVEAALGSRGWVAQELRSSRTIRSFLLHKKGAPSRLVRFALESEALEREAMAARHVAAEWLGLKLELVDPAPQELPWAYALYSGRGRIRYPASRELDVEEAAELLAHLHAIPSLRLMRSFPRQEKPSILTVFQRIVECQRNYLLYREQDGLPQDMLALTLADIGRVMRRFVVAQEHYFLPHPRRSLCHGAPDPARLIRDRGTLCLFGYEDARVGDASLDLARFALAADLDEAQEAKFLEAYMEASPRDDHRLVHRYVAHRLLVQFEHPVDRLLGLYRIKYEGAPVFGDLVDVLRQEVEAATQELAVALSSLNDFLGRGRPLAPRDVASMGRLVSFEEYLLRGRSLTIAIDGAAYTGKTPVATELAARLEASYLNIGALLRTGVALSGAEPEVVTAAQVVEALGAHDIALETTSDEPHYSVLADGEDVTELIRARPLYRAQERLLGLVEARRALAPCVVGFLRGTTVVEGERLDALLPAEARRFTLVCDEEVRARRHREHADASADEVPPLTPAPPLDDPSRGVDTSQAPFSQAALDIIQRCLPDTVRDELLVPDFTGRRPLFER